MPFDRLIRVVDQWAGGENVLEIFAQIGESDYRPKNFEFTRLLTRNDFDARLNQSSSIVSHAGTGTIIQALSKQKPLLVFPRLQRFAETRNDHQVGTAQHFASKGQLLAAFDETQLAACLQRFQAFHPETEIPEGASPELISCIRQFIGEMKAVDRGRVGDR